MVFLQPDKFWAGFCERIGLPELATDERFVPSSNLIANAEEACKLVGERLASEDLEYWREALAHEPGVWAALATPKETLNDPQVSPNGYVIPNVDDHGVEYQIVAIPVQFDETSPSGARSRTWTAHRGGPAGTRPRLGRHLGRQGQRRDSVRRRRHMTRERRELESVIYEREPPIARIVLNRPDKANTKDASLVQEVDACLHEADRDKEIKVVILKANGKGFCGGHVARWGPDENPYPDFGDTFEDLYKGTADLFLWPTLYLWEFPKPTISQVHGYCVGGGIYLGLLTDFCVASEDAYFQMPLAQSLGEPGGHTMIEPWLMMNWHRTMDWLLLAPTLSAKEALEWGLLNKVVPRNELEDTVEEMARKISQIPLTTLMAVKSNVKRAWELMGMRVHLQMSHVMTNMVGAASDVQARRAELIQSGLKPKDFIEREQT